ncbi:MAG: D-amino-acid transaminase [Alphaproteobacteria bacterium]
MTHIAYVNGRYLPHGEGAVHIEDRGYQFADGVYEYIAFYNRRMLDAGPHIRRLLRSLKELAIPAPMSEAALQHVMRELISRNSRDDGGLYIQVTRGVARRDHPFPKQTKPSLVMTICAAKFPKEAEIRNGVKVITYPDHRWERRDIKSIALLPNVLAKQKATAEKCREAWLLKGDTVTEGAVSNSYIFTKDGTLVTHPADTHILGGITRDVVLKLAKKAGMKIEERAYTIKEALEAKEAFLTSTSANILPVVAIDDKPIGNGNPGEFTSKLLAVYAQHVYEQTGRRIACL